MSCESDVCIQDIPYPIVSQESVASILGNLTSALYGTVTKTVVNGRVVWSTCDVNQQAVVFGIPRLSGEGLMCYFLRAFQDTRILAVPQATTGSQLLRSVTAGTQSLNWIDFSESSVAGSIVQRTSTGAIAGAGVTVGASGITFSGGTIQTVAANPATALPLIDGTATVGTSILYAREDHKHPSDTGRLSVSGGSLTATQSTPVLSIFQNGTGKGVTVNNTAAATDDCLTITNLGTGKSLIINDQTLPDTTAFVIDSGGNVGIGIDGLPTAKLEIQYGALQLGRQNTVDEGGHLDFSRASDNAKTWAIDCVGTDTGTNSGTLRIFDHQTALARVTLTQSQFSVKNNFISEASSTFYGRIIVDTQTQSAYNSTVLVDVKNASTATADCFVITNSGSGRSFVVNDLSGDTSPFVVDASGNVGIGTSTPSDKLQVVGTGTLANLNVLPTTAATAIYTLPENTSHGLYINVNPQTGMAGSAMLVRDGLAGSTTRFEITKTGKVGIGATATTAALRIFGGGLEFPDGSIQNTAALTSGGGVLVSSGSTPTLGATQNGTGMCFQAQNTTAATAVCVSIVNQGSGHSLYVGDQAADTTPFVVTASGRVGVGTDNPQDSLQVSNGRLRLGRIDTTSDGGEIAFCRASDDTVAWYLDQSGTSGYGAFRILDGGATVRFSVTETLVSTALPVTVTNTLTASAVTVSGNLNATGTIASTGNITSVGNVTAQQYLFAKGAQINNTTGDTNVELGGDGNVYIDFKKPFTDDYDLRISTDGTSSRLNCGTTGPLYLNDVSAQNVFAASGGGNLVVGNGTALSRLTVHGDVRLDSFGKLRLGRMDTTSEGGQLEFYRASDNSSAWIIDQAGSGNISGQLRFIESSTQVTKFVIGTSSCEFYVNPIAPDPINSNHLATKAYVDGKATPSVIDAMVTFSPVAKSTGGTWTRSVPSDTTYITLTAHGLADGNYAYLTFTGGTVTANRPVNGYYKITLQDANSFTIEGSLGVSDSGTVVMGHSIIDAVNVTGVTLGAAGIFTVQFDAAATPDLKNIIAFASQTAASDSTQFAANLASCVRDINKTSYTARVFVSDADAGTALAAPTLPTVITVISFTAPYGAGYYSIPNKPL